MDAETFVDSMKKYVCESAKQGVLQNLVNPSGTLPSNDDMRLAEGYNNLPDGHQRMVDIIVNAAVEHSIFGFLCVLDGVRPIEGTEQRGRLELYHVTGSRRTLLNNPEQEYLHDIFSM